MEPFIFFLRRLIRMMISMSKVLGCGGLMVVVWIGMKVQSFLKPTPMPIIPRDQYWGKGQAPAQFDETISPFKIEFSPEMIADLKSRLARTRYAEPLENIAFEYGFNTDALIPIVQFWANNYEFKERENFLNQYPQFKTNIQGLDIHYIHIKPEVGENIRVLPLLMLHGWPGSIREFYRIIPMLTTPKDGQDFVFELIIPSLPGFGFSEAAAKPGLGAVQIGVIMVNLMERIGHDKYYIQGGDWGSIITSSMATISADHILGYHSNFPTVNSPKTHLRMILGSFWPSMFVDKKFEHRLYPISEKLMALVTESGYFHIQATKPDTVGVGIGDSPAGLAAYILEKFSTATNLSYRQLKDGGLTKKFTYTELIDNLMIYWTSNTATSAVRIYAESFNRAQFALKVDSIPTNVPTAVAKFPFEISYYTDSQLRDKYTNLIQSTDMPRGGHFAAMEEPELLSKDIISAVVKMEQFHRKNSKSQTK